jgi:hypothetical protein
MVLIRECFHYREPFDLLNNLEWWEVLSSYNLIINNLNEVAEKNKEYTQKLTGKNNFVKSSKGDVETKVISSWKKRDKVSDYAKEMKRKILAGEVN